MDYYKGSFREYYDRPPLTVFYKGSGLSIGVTRRAPYLQTRYSQHRREDNRCLRNVVGQVLEQEHGKEQHVLKGGLRVS